MKNFGVLALAGLLVMMFAGCGTVKGFGDDISTVGRWFIKGADRATN